MTENPTSEWSQDVQQALLKCKTEKERLEQLERRLDALSEAAQQKQEEARERYLASHTTRFADMDAVRALTGAPVSHTITVGKLVSYRIRPPSGDVAHRVRTFVRDAGKLGPVTNEEATLLAWLVEVELKTEDAKAQDLSHVGEADRLSLIRQLPSALIERLADECVTLQTWLNVFLEQNMGNS